MKSIFTNIAQWIIFLTFFLASYSCTKDRAADKSVHQTSVDEFHFKGVLYNSLSGNTISGVNVYLNNNELRSNSSSSFLTDQNGEFKGIIALITRPSHNYPEASSMDQLNYLSAQKDLLAGFVKFVNRDLTLNKTLQTDIHLIPVGFLKLTLIDASMVPSVSLGFIGVAEQDQNISFNTHGNTYPDTTLLLKTFGNSLVVYSVWYNVNNTSKSKEDSAYILSGDTLVRSIAF